MFFFSVFLIFTTIQSLYLKIQAMPGIVLFLQVQWQRQLNGPFGGHEEGGGTSSQGGCSLMASLNFSWCFAAKFIDLLSSPGPRWRCCWACLWGKDRIFVSSAWLKLILWLVVGFKALLFSLPPMSRSKLSWASLTSFIAPDDATACFPTRPPPSLICFIFESFTLDFLSSDFRHYFSAVLVGMFWRNVSISWACFLTLLFSISMAFWTLKLS